MVYRIQPYSLNKAENLNVIIKPSNKRNKKIDVYDFNNNYICSIGDRGYADYPTFMALSGKKVADKHRRMYRLRHRKEKDKVDTPGYFAYHILW
jgi:hypothetical protein